MTTIRPAPSPCLPLPCLCHLPISRPTTCSRSATVCCRRCRADVEPPPGRPLRFGHTKVNAHRGSRPISALSSPSFVKVPLSLSLPSSPARVLPPPVLWLLLRSPSSSSLTTSSSTPSRRSSGSSSAPGRSTELLLPSSWHAGSRRHGARRGLWLVHSPAVRLTRVAGHRASPRLSVHLTSAHTRSAMPGPRQSRKRMQASPATSLAVQVTAEPPSLLQRLLMLLLVPVSCPLAHCGAALDALKHLNRAQESALRMVVREFTQGRRYQGSRTGRSTDKFESGGPRWQLLMYR